MCRSAPIIWVATVLAVVSIGPARADGDAARGKVVFNRCGTCHAVTEQNKTGPHLAGIFGRAAGTAPGFHYSKAMASDGRVWSAETLDAFLARPAKAIPGTTMTLIVANPQDRADVITYLKTLTPP